MRSALVLATILAACAVFGVLAVGCLGKPQFECLGAGDCVQGGMQGVCQPDKFCSFPDSSCPITGQRYGDLSGPQANQCVGPPIDAPIDAYQHDTYVHDARECFGGSGAYQLCFDMMPPMGAVTLAGTLNTDTDARCMAMPASWMTAGQPDSCLILGKAITIATVAVTGAKPLVVLGDTIQLTGTLDVASDSAGSSGPGAPSASCGAFPQAPATNVQGAGGGAGGTFKTQGGAGGTGDGNSTGGTAAPSVANPTVLRAGCPGQIGGTGVLAANAPGQGGGAVFLTASRITFTATGAINASGAGGTASSARSGGSGGGSGGMVVLHAAEGVVSTAGARIIANGGGAASGAADNNNGDSGDDPSINAPTTPAAGGDAAGNADGTGGDGFAGTQAAGTGQSAGGARKTGGGGGGGGGFIQSNVAILNMTASPAVTVVP